mmetsp:Transcript_106865/g.228199  ORF Transcript_106865/g.228199 Transcript_106865/m.228199 type:complete len:293 (-) Transcript_106865:496-1374(-)
MPLRASEVVVTPGLPATTVPPPLRKTRLLRGGRPTEPAPSTCDSMWRRSATPAASAPLLPLRAAAAAAVIGSEAMAWGAPPVAPLSLRLLGVASMGGVRPLPVRSTRLTSALGKAVAPSAGSALSRSTLTTASSTLTSAVPVCCWAAARRSCLGRPAALRSSKLRRKSSRDIQQPVRYSHIGVQEPSLMTSRTLLCPGSNLSQHSLPLHSTVSETPCTAGVRQAFVHRCCTSHTRDSKKLPLLLSRFTAVASEADAASAPSLSRASSREASPSSSARPLRSPSRFLSARPSS